MSDQTERSESGAEVTEEQKPSSEAYNETGLGGERQADGDGESGGEAGGADAAPTGALSNPSETPDEATGDAQQGMTSDDVESGEELPHPPDEGLPSA